MKKEIGYHYIQKLNFYHPTIMVKSHHRTMSGLRPPHNNSYRTKVLAAAAASEVVVVLVPHTNTVIIDPVLAVVEPINNRNVLWKKERRKTPRKNSNRHRRQPGKIIHNIGSNHSSKEFLTMMLINKLGECWDL